MEKGTKEDKEAWQENPEHNFVYNKLWLCKSQDINAAPVPVEPDSYPVFYKPIVNLYALGRKAFRAESQIGKKPDPGMFWMEALEGVHWTLDCRFDGVFKDSFELQAEKENDQFKLWKPYEEDLTWVESWVKENLSSYRGPLNIEGIGDKIMEVHLRNSTQLQLLKRRNLSYSAPVFGKDDEKYDVDWRSLPSNAIVTVSKGGSSEAGGRIGYTLANTREEAFNLKETIREHVRIS